MKKRNISILGLLTLTLTSCGLFSSEGSSVNSLVNSGNSNPSTSMLPGTSDLQSEPSTSIDLPSGEMPDFPSINAADLTTFSTDKIVDPAVTYEDDDFTVRPFPNGYTYPETAQVQPTPAYLEFWHPYTSLDFRIVASPRVFKLIEENGLNTNKELYFPVTLQLIMNGKTFTYYEVGMRMKGNTSRREFVQDDGEFTDNINFKLSFNELWTEDYYAPFNLQKTWSKADAAYTARDDRTIMGNMANGLNGLKKLDIKWNKSVDSSLVIQPFVFSLFQRHGVISQNSTLATLTYNDSAMGVVTINEPINKHLLRRYFDKDAAKGNLYKVGWDNNSMGNLRIETYENKNSVIGEEDKFRNYTPIYDRKEGKNDNSLINLMSVLRTLEGKTPAEYLSLLEEVVDIDSFLTYAALSYLTGNPDDMRNNGNNYYIFFNPSENNKAYFLPYDYDWAMGLTWEGPNMFGVSPLGTKHQGYLDWEGNRHWQSNRLYWYTIASSTNNNRPYPQITLHSAYQNTYLSKLVAFSRDSYYSVNNYNTIFNNYRTIYGNKSMSVLDQSNHKISEFNNTTLMTNFINDVKTQISSL